MLKKILIILSLILNMLTHFSTEKYTFYKTQKNLKQIFGGYSIHFSSITKESYAPKKSSHRQKFLPIEFKDILKNFKTITNFKFDISMGNRNLYKNLNFINQEIPNGGFNIKVYTEDFFEYKKLIKLLSGVFFTEVNTALNYYTEMRDKNGRNFFYNNYALNSLNMVIFKKVLDFLNNGRNFLMPSFLDPMKAFESDYLNVSCNFIKLESEVKMKVDIDIFLREFLVDKLFKNLKFRFLENTKTEIFTKDKVIVPKIGSFMDNNEFVRLIKKSEPFYKLKENLPSKNNLIKFENFFTKDWTYLQNTIKFQIKNISYQKNINFTAFLIFSNIEMPFFRKIKYSGQNYKISKKSFQSSKSPNHEEYPSTIIKIEGNLEKRGNLEIFVPFQQIHKTFETINSDGMIQNALPVSFLQYNFEGEKTKKIDYDFEFFFGKEENLFFEESAFNFFEVNAGNIVYKGKNYDTTIVFAIISVYLVFIFLLFNAVISLKDKNV